MEWGAVELHLALAGKNSAESARYLQLASHWAHEYQNSGNSDSLNLYDVSSLAHYELCRALEKSGGTNQFEITRAALLAGLKKQLDSAVKRADKDSFGLGTRYSGGDCVPHILGLVIEAGFYDDLTHTKTYADFARRQLNFVLGANAWGTSFIVGAGKVFPFHMQHQVANLAGSLDGTPPLVLGAVVDGPTRGRSSKGGDVPDGARATPWPGGKKSLRRFFRSRSSIHRRRGQLRHLRTGGRLYRSHRFNFRAAGRSTILETADHLTAKNTKIAWRKGEAALWRCEFRSPNK